MSVHRFFGATSRDAMRQVRERLGEDAMIVANRVVDGGIEILAVTEKDAGVAGDASVQQASAAANGTPHDGGGQESVGGAGAKASAGTASGGAGPGPAPVRAPVRPLGAVSGGAAYGAVFRATSAAESDEVSDASSGLGSSDASTSDASASGVDLSGVETSGVETSGAARPAAFAVDAPRRPARLASPAAAHLYRILLAAGFSSPLARALAARVPAGLDAAAAAAWARREIAARLPVAGDEKAWLAAGGVFALVGPTGVGKTTSTAKLAARCVIAHGRDAVAMLTTDGYRIGAHEQLRIYGRILGVPVLAVTGADSLRQSLHELRDKHVVLIDTVGMSQRDLKLAEQAALLCGAGRPVRRLLLLNAASHGDTLDEVAHAYRRGEDEGLAGCILTKLDESRKPGSALDVVLRHRLPIHYVSDGQRVPENFGPAQADALLARAFDAAGEALYAPTESDWQDILAPAPERAMPAPGPGADATPAIGAPALLAGSGPEPESSPASGPGPLVAPEAGHGVALSSIPSSAALASPGMLQPGRRREAGLQGLALALGGPAVAMDGAQREEALAGLAGERSVVLARELWRAALHDQAPAEVLCDLALSDVVAHAPQACAQHVLALHGRLQPPRCKPGSQVAAGSVLCSDRGDWMASPALHLLTAQGVFASFQSQGRALPPDASAQATLARAGWLHAQLARPMIHVFDAVSAAQLVALEPLGLRWLARCTPLQPLEDDEGQRTQAVGLATRLGYQPAGRVDGTGLTRWVGTAPAVLRGQRGQRHAVRLVAVRHLDAAGECRWRGLGLADSAADDGVAVNTVAVGAATADAAAVDTVAMAAWLEAAHAGRDAAAWVASGIRLSLAHAEPCAADWSRQLLVGAQLGLAAARLVRNPGPAGRLLGFENAGAALPAPGARQAHIERLTRAFGALELLDAVAA